MTESALSWLETRFPANAQEIGRSRIVEWRQSGQAPAALWRSLAEMAKSGGLLDLAVATLERGLTDTPEEAGLLADLACLRTMTGADAEAARLRHLLPPGTPDRIMPLLTAFEAGTIADPAEVRAGLMATAPWGAAHDRLVKAWRQVGAPALGASFVAEWMGRHGVAPTALARAGEALLEAGATEQAVTVLMPLWQLFKDSVERMIGPSQPPAMSPDAVIARIEAGLAAPARPPLPLPGAGWAADAARVLLVGSQTNGGREVFPNDLAAHFRNTADLAGGRLDLWLDDALGKPMEMRMTDAAIAQRVQALEAHLDASRPDILLLDCGWSLTGRGLNRDILARWKQDFGIRLVTFFRDALTASVSLIQYWAEVSDGVLLFDPHSPAFAALPGRCTAIPVPALHPPFAPATNAGNPLFVGGLAQTHRVMLLAALTRQPIDLELVIGAERLKRTSNSADYAACLGAARMVLNVASHDVDECLVTGRVWESIACGAVLLEQAGSGTESFFTPWRHYLPWSHLGDIVASVQALNRRDDLRQAIAREALSFADQHYDAGKVWRAVLAAGLGG